MSSAVAHALPPSILALFAPRVPIEFKPPVEKRKQLNYTAIAHLVGEFEDPSETPAPTKVQSVEEIKQRKLDARKEKAAEKLEALAADYDPASDPKIKGDPYKTLFVARISHETTEAKLKREFEQFGPVKRVRLVFDTVSGKQRGYAFLEFESERDMKTAYKQGEKATPAPLNILLPSPCPPPALPLPRRRLPLFLQSVEVRVRHPSGGWVNATVPAFFF